ncbi:MAG: acyl-ACP--UDP-N-acetylglucosamine O-acyltransferase [Thioalkalivibrionaceae bacterium]
MASGTLPRVTAANVPRGVHPTALVDPGAVLGADVSIGPYTIVGPDVVLGDGVVLDAHVCVQGPTVIGADSRVHSFASIGGDPQDLTYAGESTRLEIGARNVIREYATISRGTVKGGGLTLIGDDNLIMAYVHIAHDCRVGNGVVFSNAASLAGHVEIGDCVSLGGFTLVHQFTRIGAYAFSSMGAAINRDLPPFCLAQGNYARLIGINRVGLQRRGFAAETISELHRAFLQLLRSPVGRAERLRAWQAKTDLSAEARLLVDFIAESRRGVLGAQRDAQA